MQADTFQEMTPLLSQAVHQYAAGKHFSNAYHSRSLGEKMPKKLGGVGKVGERKGVRQHKFKNQIQ